MANHSKYFELSRLGRGDVICTVIRPHIQILHDFKNPAAMSAHLARREAEVEVLLNIGVEVEVLLCISEQKLKCCCEYTSQYGSQGEDGSEKKG